MKSLITRPKLNGVYTIYLTPEERKKIKQKEDKLSPAGKKLKDILTRARLKRLDAELGDPQDGIEHVKVKRYY